MQRLVATDVPTTNEVIGDHVLVGVVHQREAHLTSSHGFVRATRRAGAPPLCHALRFRQSLNSSRKPGAS